MLNVILFLEGGVALCLQTWIIHTDTTPRRLGGCFPLEKEHWKCSVTHQGYVRWPLKGRLLYLGNNLSALPVLSWPLDVVMSWGGCHMEALVGKSQCLWSGLLFQQHLFMELGLSSLFYGIRAVLRKQNCSRNHPWDNKSQREQKCSVDTSMCVAIPAAHGGSTWWSGPWKYQPFLWHGWESSSQELLGILC